MERPDIPALLEAARASGCGINLSDVTYYVGQETVVDGGFSISSGAPKRSGNLCPSPCGSQNWLKRKICQSSARFPGRNRRSDQVACVVRSKRFGCKPSTCPMKGGWIE